jgi:anti-sigma factor RsiW
MEQRIAADPALAAERDRIAALRQLLRERLPREAPSPSLRARIEQAVRMPSVRAQPSWRALAASIVTTAVIASGSTWFVLDRNQADMTENAIVSAHIRGLMAPKTTDATSSDRHTIRPWFSGRIPQAPRVIDLSTAGFPLEGARIDVIGRTPSPTLVYLRRKHIISVTAVPAAGAADMTPRPVNSDGYNIIQWIDDGVAYWAVSDLNGRELEEFVNLFRKG